MTPLSVLCAADIRKHKELIEQYDRATGQYVVTIVEKQKRAERPGEFLIQSVSCINMHKIRVTVLGQILAVWTQNFGDCSVEVFSYFICRCLCFFCTT